MAESPEMKPVIYDPEARAEYIAAANYYEEKRVGLGDDFDEEVQSAENRIRRMPKAFTPHKPTRTRKCILRRFPYTIYFRELDDRIWIAAVAHQKRRPGYWHRRKPEQ
jgi:plasmid stabilization system protein ParE